MNNLYRPLKAIIFTIGHWACKQLMIRTDYILVHYKGPEKPQTATHTVWEKKNVSCGEFQNFGNQRRNN